MGNTNILDIVKKSNTYMLGKTPTEIIGRYIDCLCYGFKREGLGVKLIDKGFGAQKRRISLRHRFDMLLLRPQGNNAKQLLH
jgi:hypothetical protein